MELFLFRHAEYERLYNCTGLEVNSIALERRRFVPESIAVCVLCAIYYVLYVPCIYSIWKNMRDNSCYKLLFYISIIDLCAMWIPGFYCGWANLRGAVFCSYPTLMYFVGVSAGSSTHLLTISPVMSHTRSLLSSRHYEPWLHKVHNAVVSTLSPFIYLIFAAKLFYDVRKSRRQFGVVIAEMGAVQIRIFSQVFLICLVNNLSCFFYVYIQNNEVNQWMITLAEFAWSKTFNKFVTHSWLPPVIYLTFNKTIREDCCLMFVKLFQRHRISHIGGVTVVQPIINLANGSSPTL